MKLPASRWLSHYDEARAQALAGDAEGVHQVRVALRRLRVWLRFGGHRKLRREVRWLRRALGELRDLDIFDEALTPSARARLRPAIEEAAYEALDSRRAERLRERLGALTPPRAGKARKVLSKLEARLERLRARASKGDELALHALRRSLRKVRYSREWLELDAKALAAEQDQLGAVCDLLSLEAFATRQLEKPPRSLRAGIEQAHALLLEHRP